MAKKIYLALLTLFTVFCIIDGSFRNLRYRNYYNENEDYEELEPPHEEEDEFIDSTSEHRIDEEVNEIDVNLSIGGVNVYMDAVDSIHLYNINNDFIEWDIKEGVLSIREKNVENIKKSDNSFYQDESLVTIALPYDSEINKMKITLMAGNLNMDGEAHYGTLDISSELGDINLYSLTINDSAVVRSKMGNVNIQDISFTDLTVEEDMGSISVYSRNDLSEYEKHCSVSLGSMYINGANIGRGFDTDGTEGKLNVTNKMGDITLDWYT